MIKILGRVGPAHGQRTTVAHEKCGADPKYRRMSAELKDRVIEPLVLTARE